ncbi:MAG: phosphopyruvate hydratase [Planctomycetota bacterium]
MGNILDSRGNPTVRVYLTVDGDTTVSASVPSGASTGRREAVELRDGDKDRYHGKGVRTAIDHVRGEIAKALRGRVVTHQADIDRVLCELDGTENKARLGANAILGVSMAAARAAAEIVGVPLYQYLGGPGARRLPVPCMNILNGGAHADNSVDLQEFMVVPLGAPSFSEGLRYNVETFYELKWLLEDHHLSACVGDEGGFAPNLESNEEALDLIVQAIENAGYRPGEDIAIAIDSAATSLYSTEAGTYELKWSKQGTKTADEMIALAKAWANKYPIVLWEDPLAEDDWEGFRKFTAALGDKMEVVGDDLFATNACLVRKGVEEMAANAALIKLNQIGTVTETIDAVRVCRESGWRYFVSHRSGETEDAFLADFAVAMDGGQLKTGSACRSERIAKYNRLLEIEYELEGKWLYYWE